MDTIKLNSRLRDMKPSPTLQIHQKINELRGKGKSIVHMGFGESPFPIPGPVVDMLARSASDGRYFPAQGLPGLRESAAKYLNRRFGHNAEAGRIIIGPGSKELIFDALFVLRGDVILPAPCWVSYAPQAGLLGKKVVWAPTDPARGYRFNARDFDRACRKSRAEQKILVLNSPCNPTGAVYSTAELKAIAEVARRHDALIVSDEIYAEIVFGKSNFASIARFCPERTVVTTGLSKGFSAGGYRLGVMLVPRRCEDVIKPLTAVIGATFSCVAAPVQRSALTAFGNDKDVRSYVKDTVAIHAITGEYLWRGLLDAGLRCPKPEGAFYLFPDFSPHAKALRRRGIRTDIELCREMLEKKHVAMLPGSAFGVPLRDLAVRLATVDYDGAAVLNAFRRGRPSSSRARKLFIEKNCPNLAAALKRIKELVEAI